MANQFFDEHDRSLMDRLKPAREKKVPPGVLKGFSASVEARIREKQPSLEIQFKPKRAWIPVWAPVFTVLIIGSLLVLRIPIGLQGIPPTLGTVEIAQANASQISDEIAALREVGVWTEDDEKSAGVSTESDVEDLELSNPNSSSEAPLA